MGSKHRFGSNYFTGLDVSLSPHLIDDASLAKSVNGWTDKEGEVSVARGRERLYTGYNAISCFAAGRQKGEDKLFWMDGNNVYVNGGNIGTINAGSDMYARDFDDSFFVMGSSDNRNFVYDGDLLRQHGTWQMDTYTNYGTKVNTSPDTYSVTNIAKGADTVITIGVHFIAAGENFYITGCNGMTELNDRLFFVKSATATTITIEEDSSGYPNWTSGGTVTGLSCGLTGKYKYYMVPTLKIVASSKVLEGKPRGILFDRPSSHLAVGDSWEAQEIDLLPQHEVIIAVGFTPSYTISGTVGTDYLYGVRIYRTKADGSDYYLEKEWWHGDTDLVMVGSEYRIRAASGITNYRSARIDLDLGAVYTAGPGDHETPPQSSLMALVGQRLLMNNMDEPNRIYFSHLDGTDYVPATNYLTIPDTVELIGSVGSVAVVMSADRMWRISFFSGFPQMDEIETSVGTTYGQIITTTEAGLLFLRKDGLWLTTGYAPAMKVGREAFSEINEPTTISSYGDILYVGDSNTGYVNLRRKNGTYWHEHRQQNTIVDATNGRFYAVDSSSVFELFAGGDMAARIQTKNWIRYSESREVPIKELQATRIVMDYSGDDVPSVFVNGNRTSDYDSHSDEGTDQIGSRRLLLFSIPRLHNHVFSIEIGMSGNGVLHGIWLEGEG